MGKRPATEPPNYSIGDLVRVGDDTLTVRRIAALERGMARLDAGADESCYGFGLIVSVHVLRPA